MPTTPEQKAKQRAATAKYRASPRGRAMILARVHSEERKAKAQQRAEYATPEWKAWAREYRKSEKGRAVDAKYRTSEKSKLTRAKYESSEHRKALLKIYNARADYVAWKRSPEGLACLRAGKGESSSVKESRDHSADQGRSITHSRILYRG